MAEILRVSNFKKMFGITTIFENINFAIEEREKVGLIGINGAGKTTLFKCLLDIYPHDDGHAYFKPGTRIGYMEQIPQFSDETTIFEAVMSGFSDVLELRSSLTKLEHQMSTTTGEELEIAMKKYARISEEYRQLDGFNCEVEAKKVLLGLGFKEELFSRPINSFSGGEKTKASLACLLIRKYDILFLDEPTNHLDLDSIQWLENYLSQNSIALLVISHDRRFLDQVTTATINLENGNAKKYPGNYSKFLELKAAEDLAQSRAYNKQQKEIADLVAYVNKYRAGIKSKQARGRQSRLDKIERIQNVSTQKEIHLSNNIKTEQSGELVLTLDNLNFSYAKPILKDASYIVRKDQRVAIIGANGAGKSTLIKIILGQIPEYTGKIKWGANVNVGYFDQQHANLNLANTVYDEIYTSFGLNNQQTRDELAKFLFTADDWDRKISTLSGGERGRLSFLKLYLEGANFLIMDEPTNHMDIITRNVFETFVDQFPGTVLMVSHDRYFIDNVATDILELSNGELTHYTGNYQDYLDRKNYLMAEEQKRLEQEKLEIAKKTKVTNEVKTNQNIDPAKLRSMKGKLRKEISEIEERISALEEEKEQISLDLADPSNYQEKPEQVKVWSDRFSVLEDEISELYENWEEKTLNLEELS